MAMEKEFYREVLAGLREKFPTMPMLTMTRVSAHLNMDARTLRQDKKLFPLFKPVGKRAYIALEAFAGWIA